MVHHRMRGLAVLLLLAATMTSIQASQALSFDALVSVQTTPAPQVELRWEGYSGDVVIARRVLGAVGTGSWAVIATTASQPYVDTTVNLGTTYEYRLKRSSESHTAYLVASLDAPLVDDQGGVILVVDNSITDELSGDVRLLEMDLVGDGWTVHRLDWGRHGSGDAVALKQAIADLVAADATINTVFLFGKLPMVRSGLTAPDGHSPNRAHETDIFYADLDGSWTDSTLNVAAGGSAEQENIPGDGKYDQNYLPSTTELRLGRITFHDMGNYRKGEREYLRDYIHKDHAFRHGHRSVPLRGALQDANDKYYLFQGRSFAHAMFDGAMDFGTLTTLADDQAYMWGMTTGASLDPMKPLQAQFCFNFKSYKQHWWRSNNAIRSMVTQPDWGLAAMWGARPQWFMHHMAAGLPIGYSAKRTIDNGRNGNEYTPQDYSMFSTMNLHCNLIGDPTVRMHPLDPPTDLSLTVGGGIELAWTASSASGLVGYHVYRSTNRLGPYDRLTSDPITANAFTDNGAPSGAVYYQVRAVAMMDLPTGSYLNQSQAAFGLRRADGGVNRAPLATAAAITVKQQTPTPVAFTGTDADGDALVPVVLRNPQHGQLRWTDGQPYYVSNSGYTGNDDMIVALSDGVARSQPVTISVTVTDASPTLLAWDFPDGTSVDRDSATWVASGLVATSLGHGPGVSVSNPFPRIDCHGIAGANGAALDADDYISWTVEPASGYETSLTRVVFGCFAPSGLTVNCALRASTDGFVTAVDVPLAQASFVGRGNGSNKGLLNQADCSGLAALQQCAETIEFRLYLWHAGASATVGLGEITDAAADAIEDLAVLGSVAPIGSQPPPTRRRITIGAGVPGQAFVIIDPVDAATGTESAGVTTFTGLEIDRDHRLEVLAGGDG